MLLCSAYLGVGFRTPSGMRHTRRCIRFILAPSSRSISLPFSLASSSSQNSTRFVPLSFHPSEFLGLSSAPGHHGSPSSTLIFSSRSPSAAFVNRFTVSCSCSRSHYHLWYSSLSTRRSLFFSISRVIRHKLSAVSTFHQFCTMLHPLLFILILTISTF
jgi:hypothetical protein